MTQLEDDCFKEEFKRYKRKDADLNDVLDFTRSQGYKKEVKNLALQMYTSMMPALCLQQVIQVHSVVTRSGSSAAQLGLIPPTQWKIYTLTSTPGMHGTWSNDIYVICSISPSQDNHCAYVHMSIH